MAKFRYYVTDLFDGCVRGTNDSEQAKQYAACEEYFVVDSESGQWLHSAEGITDIQETYGQG